MTTMSDPHRWVYPGALLSHEIDNNVWSALNQTTRRFDGETSGRFGGLCFVAAAIDMPQYIDAVEAVYCIFPAAVGWRWYNSGGDTVVHDDGAWL